MQGDPFEPIIGFVFACIAVALIVVLGFVFVIPIGIAAAIFYGVYQHYNGPEAKRKLVETETARLYQAALEFAPLSVEALREKVGQEIADGKVVNVAIELYADEAFTPPDPPPPNLMSIEGGVYRDKLNKFIAASYLPERAEKFVIEVIRTLRAFDRPPASGLFLASRPRSPREIENLILSFFGEHDFFKRLRDRLNKNLAQQKEVMPSKYTGSNCAWDYLKDTPLLPLETMRVVANWHHPENHSLVLAGSGAGKTTLFKHLIGKLLNDDCCVIVMDSQSQLIEELAHVELYEDEFAWITPEHPLALNPFHADEHELADEAFINNAIGQLEFVINRLLDAPMTPRQRTLFHHCANLVLAIPGGNIETFFSVLDDPYAFADRISKLDNTSQRFFFEELRSKGRKGSPYDSTRTELSYRLDALLRNPTLRRIFNTSENKFSMYDEMIERKLILIDTSLALLAEESATLGRFMIAQALQASYRRVKQKATERPVVFFIDEAHEYFDEKLETMLLQARKANVGMVIATQDLARASRSGIADTMLGSTTTKIVSRVVAGDARRIAPTMKTTAEFLLGLPDHEFAFFSGGEPAVSVRADLNALSGYRRRSDLGGLRKQMADLYGPSPQEQDSQSRRFKSAETDAGADDRSAMSENGDEDVRPSDAL